MSNITTLTAACGHERRAVLSIDPQRAATEIEQLVSGECPSCQKASRISTRRICWGDPR
jgi:hypothetical protein